jgi:hypothetical protein
MWLLNWNVFGILKTFSNAFDLSNIFTDPDKDIIIRDIRLDSQFMCNDMRVELKS